MSTGVVLPSIPANTSLACGLARSSTMTEFPNYPSLSVLSIMQSDYCPPPPTTKRTRPVWPSLPASIMHMHRRRHDSSKRSATCSSRETENSSSANRRIERQPLSGLRMRSVSEGYAYHFHPCATDHKNYFNVKPRGMTIATRIQRH